MTLSTETFNDLIDLLVPYMRSEDDRRSLVESALHGCAVLDQIQWRGNTRNFTTLLVRKLLDFGACEPDTPSIIALLEHLKGQVGADKQDEIDTLIERIQSYQETPEATIDLADLPAVDDDELYVFISYARPDAVIAEQVEDALQSAGVRYFRDTADIRSGNWDMTIEQALQETNRMVLLLSDSSMPYRKEVHREWFYYDQKQKPLHPLYIQDCELHSRLYAYNYIDARDDLQTALRRLFEALGAEYVPPDVRTNVDRIVVADDADERSLPEAMQALLEAIRDPEGSVALTPDTTQDLIKYAPGNPTEYRLARVAQWSQPRYQLDNRFVNLTLLLDQGEEVQQRWQPQSRTFHDLREVLAEHAQHPAFVLLGAPGSGKSTLLRRLQLDHAMDRLRDEDETISIFLQLNEYGLDSPAPYEWLQREWDTRYPDLPEFETLFRTGRLLLLLDALNEMPHRDTANYHERVGQWRQLTQRAAAEGNRIVYSCRSLDYSASLSSNDLRVPQVQVQPMTPDQIQQFLAAYLPSDAERIWQEIDGSPQFDIFRTPYFLKLLVDQVTSTDRVPTGRASLFAGFVREALKREIRNGNRLFLPDTLLSARDHRRLTTDKWRDETDLPERGALIPSLSRLAYRMQETGYETESAVIRVDYDDACDWVTHERDEDILRAGVNLNVLDEDLSRLEILFFHQLLQEFFAARQLADAPQPELVRVAWHVDAVSPSLDDELARIADSDPLPPLPQTGWEETTLLAAAMTRNPDAFVRDLLDVNLPLAARCAAAPDVTISDDLISEIQQRLIQRTQTMDADVRARIAAGEALGQLGDPRFDRKTGDYGDYLLPPLVTVPAGTYTIGDDDGQYDREKPAHPVELETFQIGQFPVTNAEYALFMAAGGYDDEQWWDTDVALAWLRGQGSTEGQKSGWRDLWTNFQSWSDADVQNLVAQNRITSEQANEWIIVKNWSKDRLEEWLDETYPSGQTYREPEYWNDTRFNNPQQPVVGVTWYEARAYCNWLAAQTGQPYMLPSEAQWEAAARGQRGWQYPYGETFDVSQGNTFESHLRRSTPVGIYPPNPDDIYDLSGNVYDWTRSIFDQDDFPYPYEANDGRENINSPARRVLRGGSWNFYHSLARAAYRDHGLPDSRVNIYGFRLVCPPSLS